MSNVRLSAAIVYDFDGTLSHGNMQDSLISDVLETTSKEFWKEVQREAKDNDGDEILAYMRSLICKSNSSISREILRDYGKRLRLFPGLEDESWFDRIDLHARENDLDLNHYIVSSGLEEMILGSPIAGRFRRIFASKFIWQQGRPVWPAVAINYTTKTQYLFRINKGIENHYDRKTINDYMAEHKRPIPFERMVFIGDGATDIPAMKMMTIKGGCGIAVYDAPDSGKTLRNIHQLIADRRVNFVAPADYSRQAPMDIIVKGILSRIAKQGSDRARTI